MNPTQFYKCLADETRLTLLMLIQIQQEACVCHLMEALQQDQPKISRHLALLRQHNLVQGQRRGKWIFYRLHGQLPSWCKQVIEQTTAHNARYIEEPLSKLSHLNNSSNNCC